MKVAIVVFAYNRWEYLKQMMESLAECRGIRNYDLFIYIDGGIDQYDKDAVSKVRDYIDEMDKQSFGTIVIRQRNQHFGLSKSVIQGVTEVFEDNDAIICIEDDLILSKDFLEYMSKELIAYKDNDQIWAVSGYCPYLNSLEKMNAQTFLSYRSSSWGWATWENRWNVIDWEVKDYDKFQKSRYLRNEFERGGTDLTYMLDLQMKGMIDSWAIRWCYAQWKLNKMAVYPKATRVKNVGFDKNATHTKKRTEKEQEFKLDHSNDELGEAIMDYSVLEEFRKIHSVNQIKAFIKIKLIGDLLYGVKECQRK